jgi:hypothetical protein
MRSVTKENTIDRPSLKLIQIFALLQNKAFATKHMEMTHLGSATMHHLIARLLLECSEKNPIRNIACGIDLKTMCGSRTSGWSLPGVMSD